MVGVLPGVRVSQQVSIICSRRGCGFEQVITVPNGDGVYLAAEDAYGWGIVNSRLVCPECMDRLFRNGESKEPTK